MIRLAVAVALLAGLTVVGGAAPAVAQPSQSRVVSSAIQFKDIRLTVVDGVEVWGLRHTGTGSYCLIRHVPGASTAEVSFFPKQGGVPFAVVEVAYVSDVQVTELAADIFRDLLRSF